MGKRSWKRRGWKRQGWSFIPGRGREADFGMILKEFALPAANSSLEFFPFHGKRHFQGKGSAHPGVLPSPSQLRLFPIPEGNVQSRSIPGIGVIPVYPNPCSSQSWLYPTSNPLGIPRESVALPGSLELPRSSLGSWNAILEWDEL